jgi:hypothetical protein
MSPFKVNFIYHRPEPVEGRIMDKRPSTGSGLRLLAASLCLLIAACQRSEETPAVNRETDAGDALDKQAIAAGILPEHDNLDLAGRFETRSDLGTDKFCAVGGGSGQFNIGVLAVFGPESKCEGQGKAGIEGEKVRITLSGKKACSFDAEFDGVELRIPGSIEQGCASYCSPRASLSGTSYFKVEQGDANARRALGRDIEKLCD